ncbi:NFX1-type zinc finger-containing protein 1 [Anabrus simplex]|uniref:NFX1-type zinc finger-containing protein 1 n=1 Tax=Anabrus simplex TaxID=316456 RepID=UPI0035A3219A
MTQTGSQVRTRPVKNYGNQARRKNSSLKYSTVEVVELGLQKLNLSRKAVQSFTEVPPKASEDVPSHKKTNNWYYAPKVSTKDKVNSKFSKKNVQHSRSGEFSTDKLSRIEDDNLLPDRTTEFRKHNVFLGKIDIEEKVVLQANIIKGSFDSVNQYLKIQFYLLREDFVGTIRDDIANFTKAKPRNTPQVKIYNRARFIRYEVKKNKCGVLVQFEPKKGQNTSEFMQGALLGFTKDNFKNYFFGSVLEHTKKGEVVVKMFDQFTVGESSHIEFTMIEPVVFYEPYFHVMKALQDIDDCNFPMKRYIINGDNVQRPPAYLLGRNMKYTIGDSENVPVLDLASDKWPTSEKLNLDESQYRAFQTALTQEFVVIQGPPGTGKTYLGLQVAEALLNNKDVWYKGSSPIMVVCYTNHALDQFLEGLLEVTKDLVRIGGQSKSASLKPYNLRNQGKTVGWGFFSEKKFISQELHHCVKIMKQVSSDLESIERKEGIISLGYFARMGIVTEQEVEAFIDVSKKNNFLSWLLCNDYRTQNENYFNVYEKPSTPSQPLYDWGDTEVDDYCPIQYYLRISDLEQSILAIKDEIHYWRTSDKDQHLVHSRIWVLEEQCLEVMGQLEKLKSFLSLEHYASKTLLAKFSSGCQIWNLSYSERWAIYKHWEAKLKNKLREIQYTLNKNAQEIEDRFQSEQARCNAASLHKTLIFGMTTTGAARSRELLHMLKPRIVIVEEAAEVMESHIVASLTPYCEHLILIGDHQQLRPSVNVHRLRLHFGFDISLFERMVNNGLNCETLQVQHRMRPEISRLIVPTIYPKLENHSSVYNFPPIKGMTANVYFLSHDISEDEMSESLSHKNSHEVMFVIMLGRHLVLQGYEPSEITIITTYKAQMLSLSKERDKYLQGVRVSTVDDFQGEENKIILLSLVRSSEGGQIGFLKTENRICVALSRAKEGFYMIGNMKNLTKQSGIWKEIHETLIQQNAVGPSLLVQCQHHPEQMNNIFSADDFRNKVPEGGCSLFCSKQLECSHKCPYNCHIVDMEHKDRYKCREVCDKVMCPENHKCRKECWEKCNGKCVEPVVRLLPCGHEWTLPCYIDWKNHDCKTKVLRELPCQHIVQLQCHIDWKTYQCTEDVQKKASCGHIITVRCCTDMKNVTCPSKCLKILPCGHKCNEQCHTSECPGCTFLTVKKFSACGHIAMVQCSDDINKMTCSSVCSKTLPCGHRCAGKCGAPCPHCRVEISDKSLPCGHEIKIKCGTVPSSSDCYERCNRKLPCGHLCTALCNEPCVAECMELCTFKKPGICGHEIKFPCFQHGSVDADSEELLSYCDAPCGKILPCGHKCNGSCSKCLQGRLHTRCTEICDKILICGHRCAAPCYLSCPPCSQKYTYTCCHQKQDKRCFKKLDLCTKPCMWECEHRKCSKACGDLCTRKPCEVACKELLPCGHSCIGFCGDPCPPLCIICDKDEITNGSLLSENVDGTALKFVFLVDCKHTIEISELEDRISKCEEHVLMLTCPKCGTAIINTPRFRNYAKTYFHYEMAIKSLVFKKKRKIESQKSGDVSLLRSLIRKEHIRGEFKTALNTICLKTRGDYFDAETFHLETCIANQIMKNLQKIVECGNHSIKWKATVYLQTLVNALAGRSDDMSTEELNGWLRELLRLERIVQVCELMNMPNLDDGSKYLTLNSATKILFSIESFSKENDSVVESILKKIILPSDWKISSEVHDLHNTELLKIAGMNEGYWLKSHIQSDAVIPVVTIVQKEKKIRKNQ